MRPADLVDRIDWIVRLDDEPVRRNLLITQCYHDLSEALARRVGAEDLNWCGFATWASRTAGRFIRGEEVPHAFRAVLDDSEPIHVSLARVNDALGRIHEDATLPHDRVLDLARRIVHDVGTLITAGNLTVFGELGPLFSHMIKALDHGSGRTELERLSTTLSPGLSERGGQSLLQNALAHYAEARDESNPHLKAERMLLANAQVGLHEQIRLQPFIAGSIDAPISDSVYETLELGKTVPSRILRHAEAIGSRLLHPVADAVERHWEEFCTKEMMTLSLPDGTLVLGRDLPAPPGQALYPRLLERLDDPETAELFDQYGANRPTALGSAAIDWTRLSDRMRYILDLFRSRQRDPSLYSQPFTEEQRAAILAGRPVSGKL